MADQKLIFHKRQYRRKGYPCGKVCKPDEPQKKTKKGGPCLVNYDTAAFFQSNLTPFKISTKLFMMTTFVVQYTIKDSLYVYSC